MFQLHTYNTISNPMMEEISATNLQYQSLGLWELCSKFLSLFYFEFPLKSLHYAQFYS